MNDPIARRASTPTRRYAMPGPEWVLDIAERELAGCHLMGLQGEVDMFTATFLEPKVCSALEGGARSVIIDLHATTFLDVAGVTALFACSDRIAGAGRKFAVVASRTYAVELLFQIVGPDPRLPTCADERDAIEFVSGLD